MPITVRAKRLCMGSPGPTFEGPNLGSDFEILVHDNNF